MFVYLLDIKNGDQLISAIVRTKEEDLIRITREKMLKEILSWDDETVQFAAPFLRIVVPLLLELKNILNNQVITRKLKADMWKECFYHFTYYWGLNSKLLEVNTFPLWRALSALA